MKSYGLSWFTSPCVIGHWWLLFIGRMFSEKSQQGISFLYLLPFAVVFLFKPKYAVAGKPHGKK